MDLLDCDDVKLAEVCEEVSNLLASARFIHAKESVRVPSGRCNAFGGDA